MKTVIKVACVDQTLQLTAAPAIACGGRTEDRVEFSFCPLWQGHIRIAVFWRPRKEAYYVMLDPADSCIIPAEVLQTEGVLHFGVFGVDPDGVRRTTEVLTYPIGAGPITEDLLPPDPTPELYTQVLAAAAVAQSVRAEVDAGLLNGADGYTPAKGVDYWTDADKAEIKSYVDDAILGGAW